MSDVDAATRNGEIPKIGDLSKQFETGRKYLLYAVIGDLEDIKRGIDHEFYMVIYKDPVTGDKHAIFCKWKACVPNNAYFTWTNGEIQRSGVAG